MSGNMEDMQELSNVLNVITDKVPALIKSIIETLYSPEAGVNLGRSVGALYRELITSGVPEADALEMAKDYMLSLRNIMNSVNNNN